MNILSKALALMVMAAPSAFAQSQPILIFGGEDHRDFLGCLTCSQYDANSVWNQYSTYGWANRYGTWSQYGPYKSAYSATSACNQYATDPPVLVDQTGTFYGRLSINPYIANSICGSAGNDDICNAAKAMCASN